MVKRFLFSITFFVHPLVGFAHPVSYKGAVAVMTWNQSYLSDYWLAYSFSPSMAGAARAMRMEMPEGQFLTAFPQFDRLIQRWNNSDSQANIYGYGGFGGARFQNRNGYAGLVGLETDAESRRWFVLGRWESMWSHLAKRFDKAEFRLGLAPYEAEFNELASWLMVQFQYHPALKPAFAITPLYRMFYKSVLWEAGISLQGDWMLNMMFHY
jgi:hypothetical protein